MRKVGRILSRRDFGKLSAAALAAPLVGFGSSDSPSVSAFHQSPTPQKPAQPATQKLNILFIFGDQEQI
jgi:hypothetical protein